MTLYALYVAIRRLCRSPRATPTTRRNPPVPDRDAADPAPDDNHHETCGWYASSWELCRGVDVEEHVWLDAGLPDDALAAALRFE